MNVADQITAQALALPHKRAVVATSGKDSFGNYRYVHHTFIELEKRINQFARALKANGVRKGDKTLLFARPCLDFSALAFALFKIGACPVFIDPGMGRRPFLEAIRNCAPRVLIGIPKVFVLKKIFSKWFDAVELDFVYSPRGFFGVPSIVKLARDEVFELESEKMGEEDLAAILFTSGGTGKPKGVVYTHDIFINQTAALKEEFELTDSDVDVPGFPLFALFTLSMGMTSCIPDMDPSKPAKADPKKLMRVIKDQGATFAAGSPAIWKNLGEYCAENRKTLPSLKHLVMFGAPIPLELHQLFSKVLPNGDTHTPYGATESLPVSNARGSEILELAFGERPGVYIGFPLKNVEVKVIRPVNGVLEEEAQITEKKEFEIGEIIVSSPTTTKFYYQLPQKNLEAKIKGQNGKVWHRMGDMGYKDEAGALWFCGRKAHSFRHQGQIFYPVPVEQVFNQHPMVKRSALINSPVHGPGIAIERQDGKTSLSKAEASKFGKELMSLATSEEASAGFKTFFLTRAFPVDVRHNIKIDRKKLGRIVKDPLEIS